MRSFYAWALCAIFLASAAFAQTPPDDAIVVSTGKKRGSYYYIAKRLNTEMVLAHSRPIEVVTSEGSLENLSRLADPASSVNVAFAQADALRSHLEAHPELAGELFVLGNAGKECVLLVAGAAGGLQRANDLMRPGERTISVDAPGSGAALTFEAINALEPRFGNTRPVYVPVMEALLQLAVGAELTDLQAVMLVQRPRRVSPALEVVLDKPGAYRLLPFQESDLPNPALPDSSKIYTFEKITVGGRERRHSLEVETVCTRALLLGSRTKLSRERRSQLSSLMLESGDRIVGKDE